MHRVASSASPAMGQGQLSELGEFSVEQVCKRNHSSLFFCRVSERCVPPLEVCVGKVKLSDERFFLVEAAQTCCRDILCLSQHPKALIAGVSLDQGFWQSWQHVCFSASVFFSMLASVEGHFHFFSHHGKPF